jgi:hypothetical protein
MQVKAKRAAVKADRAAQETLNPNVDDAVLGGAEGETSASGVRSSTGAWKSTDGFGSEGEAVLGSEYGPSASDNAQIGSTGAPRSSTPSGNVPTVPVMIATPLDGSAALEEMTRAATVVQHAVRSHQGNV